MVNILGFPINKSVRREDLQTDYVAFEIPAGTTQTINFPIQTGGIAVSLSADNQSGGGAATYQVNGTGGPTKTLAASTQRLVSLIPVVQIRVTTHAGGSVFLEAEIAKSKDVL